ncbi:LOW QUALITY PROTEIN: probable leucine--tRNA ligase, mitochondrial [Lepeophtheirus salmonis]|uniref:LOW QUALITY PROTEIN: probable leucine--tRNA ligase, mitochondrial n=1 Tax=Lepeophtheirus salmonis TaxID=72036 RepID=UPI001AE91365|nr:LOW QUALITY PROTEIN: probable leucine--tRNA ligase, mitochondrial [Lepeophtheirus salmonis]
MFMLRFKKGDKKYVLSMFPYPSGRLHMGHVRVYTISDAIARYYTLKNGVPSFQPMGFDAFGLPAENAAIERQESPSKWTLKNIEMMRSQLNLLGLTFNWSDPPLSTCDPENYYKWTQWIFLKMFKEGMAYKKTSCVNWDPIDCTVLADEQVDEEGKSWRSGAIVEKKKLKQWYLQTTRYSQDLYDGLNSKELVDWEDIKDIQRNWIGKCDGINISFAIENEDDVITVWTPDPPSYIHSGIAFIALSQHHPLAARGLKVLMNPISNEQIPLIVIHNDILFHNGTDAFMGIPELSEEHARICRENGLSLKSPIFKDSKIINSGEQLNGLSIQEGNQKVIQMLQNINVGGYKTSSKLKDWLISRQRYWGTPIPIIYCKKCGTLPVPEEDLPVSLPDVENLNLGIAKEGISPLSKIENWYKTTCPKCYSSDATRETDTMDTFVDSSWYFLRHIDPKNDSELIDKKLSKENMPVDVYIGGKEHAVLHLFFARFVNRFLFDIGVSPVQEPFKQLIVQGLVKSKSYKVKSSGKYLLPQEVEDPLSTEPVKKGTLEPLEVKWEKMSKSKHNGVEPTEIIEKYGCDMTRFLILADVSPKSDRNWSEDSFVRIKSLTSRLWSLVYQTLRVQEVESTKEPISEHEYKKQLADLVDARNYYFRHINFSFGTNRNLAMVISRIHGLLNILWNVDFEIKKNSGEFQRALGTAIILLSPIAPHFCSELWFGLSSNYVKKNTDAFNWNAPLFQQKWPSIDLDYSMKIKILKNNKPFINVMVPYSRFQSIRTKEEALEICCREEPSKKYFLLQNKESSNFRMTKDYEAVLNFTVKLSNEEIAYLREKKAEKKKKKHALSK